MHIYTSVKVLGCGWLAECALKKIRARLFIRYTAIWRWWESVAEEDMEGGVECVVSIMLLGLVNDLSPKTLFIRL